MATKAKESSVIIGKEKKAPSSTSPITSTKRSTKPSTTTTRSPTDKATSNPTEKQVPNYLKPTISSRLVESQSFKLPKSDASSNKPTLNRRRSFDKPPSPSRLPRQHKALVSPGPRERSSLPLIKSTNPSKPISQRISKTPKDGKTQHPLIAKSRSPSPSTSSTKKLPNNASETKTTTEELNVETEPEVKEAINEKVEEVEKVENQKLEVENDVVSEIPPHAESESEHEHDQEVEESDQLHTQTDDENIEKVIPTVSEEEDKHEEEDENRNQDECNNINEIHPEMINHSTTEEEVDEVKEKEEEEGEQRIEEEEHKSENNNEEEAVVVEEKEGVNEGEINHEDVKVREEWEDEKEHVESEVKEAKDETTQPKQQGGGVQHGKKESQVSNDVIEETASKLLEARKNKVKALAGAFQTVIDYQTK